MTSIESRCRCTDVIWPNCAHVCSHALAWIARKWQPVRGRLRDTHRESRQKKAKRGRMKKKLLTVKTPRRRQNSSSAKETEQAGTCSEARGEAAVGECKKGAKPLSQPLTKRKSKVVNAKERKLLIKYLDSMDDMILANTVKDDLNQQLLADNLKRLAHTLCDNEELLSTLVSCHRKCFADLYSTAQVQGNVRTRLKRVLTASETRLPRV